MGIKVPPEGPVPARIMLVGEAPGADEEVYGRPFVGTSGMELDRMLSEAKISRSECFVTNVARERPLKNDINQFIYKNKTKPPPEFTHRFRGKFVTRQIIEGVDLLQKEIREVSPNIIIALGNVPMWALTGEWGVTKWRGSMLMGSPDIAPNVKVIPAYHPAAVLRQWNWRQTTIQDFRRAARFRDGSSYPIKEKRYIVRPNFQTAVSTLHRLLDMLKSGPLRISFDLETRAGHIACAGFSWTSSDALCIPFMCVERREGYWALEEETQLVYLIRLVLTHANAQVVGQNILYDSQYTWRHWHFVPRVVQDCMISQHSIYSDLPKSLAFQASMYCDFYRYWKDDGKNWDPKMGEDSLWIYNCDDCINTDEVGQVELKIIQTLKLEEVHSFQQKLFWPVLRAMQLGVRVDTKMRDRLIGEVMEEISKREHLLTEILGHPLNPRSPQQMQRLFYEDLKQPIIWKRNPGGPSTPTLNDEALQTISKREPLLRPLINCISDIRTLGIFLSNFLTAPLDEDQRMRCAYNIGGSESGKSAPKTYRLSSSENAFGSGTNLQNIPSEKSKSVGKAIARGSIGILGDPYSYPNIRSMFIPDEGYTFFDLDLDRADLQVVVWEADDEMLKAALRLGADIHLMNAYVVEGRDPPPLEELIERHKKDEICTCGPRCYWDYRRPMSYAREFSKVFCHATNYLGKARTVAGHTGRTVAEIERAQKIWFGAHPGIQRWHERVIAQVNKYRFVENKFGYRWYIFDRIDGTLYPEAVAWIPQSTVSVVINKAWDNIYRNLPEVQVLLQVHDALCGQFPSHRPELAKQIQENARIVVPYEDPLIIPVGMKTSNVSWGDCA